MRLASAERCDLMGPILDPGNTGVGRAIRLRATRAAIQRRFREGGGWRALKPLLRDAFLAFAAVLLTAFAASNTMRNESEAAFRHQTIERLELVADAISTVIDPDAHARIASPEQLNGPDFRAVADPMLAIRDAVDGVKYVYTTKVEGDRAMFVVDCTPQGDADGDGVEDQAGVFETYEDAPPELFEAARTGKTTWTNEPYRDKWGVFMSVWRPLRDSNGDAYALLGIDMSVEQYEAEIAALARASDRGRNVAVLAGFAIGAFVFILRVKMKRSEHRRAAAQVALERSLLELATANQIAQDANRQKSEHIAALQRAQKRILQVARGVSQDAGTGFLEEMTRRMAISLEADFALVGVVDGDDRNQVRSLAFIESGERVENVTYPILETPCEAVIRSGEARVYVDEVASLFPKDVELVTLGAVAYVGVPMLDSDGNTIGLVSVLYRRPLEEAVSVVSMLRIFATRAAAEVDSQRVHDELRRSRERLASTFAALGEGVIVYSKDGDLIDCNPAALRILAVNEEQLRRMGPDSPAWAVTTEDGAGVRDDDLPYARAITTGDSQRERVMRVTRGDSASIWIAVTAEPVRGADGDVIASVVSFFDVTEAREHRAALERAKDEAESANRSKSDFLANMSHEIRTPMTAILGYADLLRDEIAAKGGDRSWIESLDSMRSNGEHLIALINDILDLSKIEAGKMTIECVATDLDALIADALAIARLKAESKGLRLVAEYETEIPPVIRTDPIRVRQVLVNLVGNAVKFTERGSVRIRVSIGRVDSGIASLRIVVVDTGIGMNVAEMSRLFGAFAQVDASVTRRYGGTGLGLRISKRLAQMLGGDLTVASSKGNGSVFTFEIPVEVPSANADAPASRASHASDKDSTVPVQLSGLRVLIADDGADNRRILTLVLERAGARVKCVNDGRDAIAALTVDGSVSGALREPPEFDLVLMDMQMPEMDGYTAVRELRSRGLELPVIAVTAHAMAGDRESCLAAGCDEHATKPIQRAPLLALCRAALDGELRDQRSIDSPR